MAYREKSAVLLVDLLDRLKDSTVLLDSALCLLDSRPANDDPIPGKVGYLIGLYQADLLSLIEMFEDDFAEIEPKLTC
ncbi:hypothetical protein [Picosynechococcus sp. NKBG042902]|uniref:hypothetical protein n=1 Tax=Picosynechococcus sp. NKBG042902 TaxID=490193 RepID=UPI0004ABB2D7|nr:hypothetical protein [Picosynechococcus sp. NKBG042902]